MIKKLLFFFLPLVIPALMLASKGRALPSEGHVNIVKIDGIINPIVADFISRAIKASGDDGASALIVELDTPGGLDLSMRQIVKDVLNAPVPVIVYVSPSGARAASAGAMITMAGHIAAMAPGTNIGAAHPVNIGGSKGDDETMMKKVENDAAAYIMGIANKRGRNTEWAEKAVRESASITAEEAKKLKVIDFVAPDLNSLLDAAEETEVTVAGGKKVKLSLKGLERRSIEMDLRHNILNIISDPNIAYLLMMLGFLGLYLELSNPGLILPGVIGGVSLILAFVAFQTLPINYGGVMLVIVGVILLFLEIMIVSYGMLTIGGIALITLGSLMLFETTAPFLKVSYSIIFPTVAAISAIFIFIITFAVKAQSRDIVTGKEGLIGMKGKVSESMDNAGDKKGTVFVHGELWQAKSDEPLVTGENIIVVDIHDMVLKVKRDES